MISPSEPLRGEIVVTWPTFDLDDPMTGRRLVDAGLSVRLEPKLGARTAVETRELLGDAVGVIASTDPFDRELFESRPNLRVIARTGVGFDAIDVAAANAAGVVIATTPGAGEETVADHTLALMLSLVRRISEHDQSVRSRRWDRAGALTPGDMVGATVGLIGCGVIGHAVIRRVLSFGSRVLVNDPALSDPPAGTELCSLDELFASCDVISIHVPLTDGTRGLIGADELSSMKPGAVLVNAARGHIVDEVALAHALRSGHLAAAALDVFEEEPPFNSELLALPNTILTPHIGGLSTRAIAEMTARATASVLQVLRGEVAADAIHQG
jgi:D-3-phosphoglycerate dehydrogenase